MNPSGFIKRHPVVSYFVLAYAIAWGGILAVASAKGFRADRFEILDAMLMFLAMLVGPSMTSLILTAVVDGKNGLRSLWARMTHWRVGARWYAMALLFPILILAVLVTLSVLISPLFTPSFTVIGIVIGLFAGFFEEIGWTGFALPRLELKHSPVIAGLAIGVLWGLWHILAEYFGNSSIMGPLWLPYFLFGFVAAMIATRILITWVYNQTGSILLAQLMHASSTGFLAALGVSANSPMGPSGYALAFIVYAVALWVLVAISGTQLRKRLARKTVHADRALWLPD